MALAQVVVEQQARIEVEALQQRVKEMEEFVEKADAARCGWGAGGCHFTCPALQMLRQQRSFGKGECLTREGGEEVLCCGRWIMVFGPGWLCRLEMAAKVSELTAQLAAVRRDEQQSFDQVPWRGHW